MIQDTVERLGLYADAVEGLRDVIRELDSLELDAIEDGTYFTPEGIRYFIQSFESSVEPKMHEVHARYIDLQIVVEGRERLTVSHAVEELPPDYREESDIGFDDVEIETTCHLRPGNFAMLFPFEPHAPGLSESEKSEPVRKIVVKIPFSMR